MAESTTTPCRTTPPACNLLVGFTASYDRASNRLYERALHAGCRSTVYATYDSLNRLREYQRGLLTPGSPGSPGSSQGGDESLPTVEHPITLSGADQERTYDLDGEQSMYLSSVLPRDTRPREPASPGGSLLPV